MTLASRPGDTPPDETLTREEALAALAKCRLELSRYRRALSMWRYRRRECPYCESYIHLPGCIFEDLLREDEGS